MDETREEKMKKMKEYITNQNQKFKESDMKFKEETERLIQEANLTEAEKDELERYGAEVILMVCISSLILFLTLDANMSQNLP